MDSGAYSHSRSAYTGRSAGGGGGSGRAGGRDWVHSESALNAPEDAAPSSSAMVPYHKGGRLEAQPPPPPAAPATTTAVATVPTDHLDSLYQMLESERPGFFSEIASRLWSSIHIQFLKVWEFNAFSPTLEMFKLDCERSRITTAMWMAIQEAHEHRENLRGLRDSYDMCETKFLEVVRVHHARHEATCKATGRNTPFSHGVLMETLSVDEDGLYNQLQMWKVQIASVRRLYTQANFMVSDCHRDFDQNTESREQLRNTRLVDKIVTQMEEARKIDTSRVTDEVIGRLEAYQETMRERHTTAEANNRLYTQSVNALGDARSDMRDQSAARIKQQEGDGNLGDTHASWGNSERRQEEDALMTSIFSKLHIFTPPLPQQQQQQQPAQALPIAVSAAAAAPASSRVPPSKLAPPPSASPEPQYAPLRSKAGRIPIRADITQPLLQ